MLITGRASHAGPACCFASRVGYEMVCVQSVAEADDAEHHHQQHREHQRGLYHRAAALFSRALKRSVHRTNASVRLVNKPVGRRVTSASRAAFH